MPHLTHSKHPLHSLIKAIVFLTTLYGVVASLFLLLRKRLTEDNKLISMFNAFAHIVMMPALVLLPISIFLRRPWLTLSQLVPTAVFVSSYARFFLPQPPLQSDTVDRQLRLLTFNLHGEEDVLEPMLDIIRQSQADIVSVQELRVETADCFKSALTDLYPYQAMYPAKNANRGQGVLSRYPITDHNYWRNPHIAQETLGHLRAEIDIDGTTVTLYNTHPIHPGMGDDGFSTRPRGAEIDVVLAQAAQDSGPVLIMGDFNMTDQSEDYRRITTSFGDSFGEAGGGMGFTFPDLSSFESLPGYWPLPVRLIPFLRLDYIFYNSAFKPINAYVWPISGGSDHRPVFALLALTNGDRA